MDKLKVIYRKFPEGDVIALFPELPEDMYGYSFRSYQHIGQHGIADDGIIQNTYPANPSEYADLHKELQSIYDDCELVICKRISSKMWANRRKAVNDYYNYWS